MNLLKLTPAFLARRMRSRCSAAVTRTCTTLAPSPLRFVRFLPTDRTCTQHVDEAQDKIDGVYTKVLARVDHAVLRRGAIVVESDRWPQKSARLFDAVRLGHAF